MEKTCESRVNWFSPVETKDVETKELHGVQSGKWKDVMPQIELESRGGTVFGVGSFAFITLPEFPSLYDFGWVLVTDICPMSTGSGSEAEASVLCSEVWCRVPGTMTAMGVITHVSAHLFGVGPYLDIPVHLLLLLTASSRPSATVEKGTNLCCKWAIATIGGNERLMWILVHLRGYPCPWPRPTFFSNCQPGEPLGLTWGSTLGTETKALQTLLYQLPWLWKVSSPVYILYIHLWWFCFSDWTLIQWGQEIGIHFFYTCEMLVAYSGENVYGKQLDWWAWVLTRERNWTVFHTEIINQS